MAYYWWSRPVVQGGGGVLRSYGSKACRLTRLPVAVSNLATKSYEVLRRDCMRWTCIMTIFFRLIVLQGSSCGPSNHSSPFIQTVQVQHVPTTGFELASTIKFSRFCNLCLAFHHLKLPFHHLAMPWWNVDFREKSLKLLIPEVRF